MADEINTEIHQERRFSKDISHDDHQEDLSMNHVNGNEFIDDSNINNEFGNNSDQMNSFDPLLINNETTNIDASLDTDHQIHDDKPDEFKAQRELDENEIPPAEVPVDKTPIDHETTPSSTESESNITDDRPLTALETPYEHHETELSPEQDSSNNHSFTEVEAQSPHIEQIEVSEEEQDDDEEEEEDDDELNESIKEETPLQSEPHFTEEDFPPLASPEAHQIPIQLNEEDYPPLPTPAAATILEQINHLDNKEEEQQQQPLLSTPLPESEDILGNKTLIKQIIEQGIPSTRPTRSTLATISYTLSLVDNLTSDIRVIETVSNESFFISEFDMIPAIDLSVQFMNRGERAIIDSDIRHCYGELGCEEKQIPPANNQSYRMKIDLELYDWKSPPDVQTLSIDERLFWGDKKRQMGNLYYRRREYSNALQCYRGALRFLDITNNPISISFDESQRSILIDGYIQVQNNVAQVNLFLLKYPECLNAVENVLRHDPKNVKALFRQGKALFELGKYDQAIQPLKTFAQIQRGNASAAGDYDKVNEMITTCENKLANYQKNEKEIYRRMFQPTPSTTTGNKQQRQSKQNKQTDNSSNNWWLYIGLGSAALAAVGLFTFMKYRKTS
ncbi:hypothetical protein I4U23_031219 [Adineta vaga]|nr:hypothetical protein I4U23_031219 [Adineta vaga]